YFLFQVLVEIILLVWLIRIILKGRVSIRGWISQIKFIFPALVFIFILGLATIFSQSLAHSFWGYYFRKMGYLIWLHFSAFFLILFFNLKTLKQIFRIFYVIVITLTLVVAYGVLQVFGFDIFSWSEGPVFTGRVFSTLGQPNFLGSWLLLAIPMLVWLISKVNHRRLASKFRLYFLKPILISLFLVSIFVLVLTQSRGAWIGFFFGFFFFSVIFAWLKKQKRLARLLLILFAVILIFIGYLNLYPLSSKPDDSFLKARFKTLSQFSTIGKLRLIWWQNSLELIQQKPILGYGPETQHLNFIRYYTPEFAALEAINNYPDRAHNDILDMLLISGILGLVSYLFFIGTAFYFGLKYIFKSTINHQPSTINHHPLFINWSFGLSCFAPILFSRYPHRSLFLGIFSHY
ncbi:O-antigen ligase family protein, partial [Patescibacteria group bacterium]|nr:O-antigen ligase family protein [Patescibacteria group bacterium]